MTPEERELLGELRAEIRDAEEVRSGLLNFARTVRDNAIGEVEFRLKPISRATGDNIIGELTIARSARRNRIERKEKAEKAYAARVFKIESDFDLVLAEIDRRYRARLEALRDE